MKKISLLTTFMVVFLGCAADVPSAKNTEDDKQLYEKFHKAPRIDAEEAAQLMQKYCAAAFPLEESIISRLKSDGYILAINGKTWFHPTNAVNFVPMESSTGRGYGCGMTFYSNSPAKKISHKMDQIVREEGSEVFSVWLTAPKLIAIFNRKEHLPDEQFAAIPASEKNQYLALLTEK